MTEVCEGNRQTWRGNASRHVVDGGLCPAAGWGCISLHMLMAFMVTLSSRHPSFTQPTPQCGGPSQKTQTLRNTLSSSCLVLIEYNERRLTVGINRGLCHLERVKRSWKVIMLSGSFSAHIWLSLKRAYCFCSSSSTRLHTLTAWKTCLYVTCVFIGNYTVIQQPYLWYRQMFSLFFSIFTQPT